MSNEFHDYPEGFVTEEIVNAATREIANYTVMFASNGQPLGSGTLVLVDEAPGILTAAHVTDILIHQDDAPTIDLVIADTLHRLRLDKKYAAVKRYRGAGDEAKGPDIAFLRIGDLRVIGTLKARKSFRRLSLKMSAYFDAIEPPAKALCFFAGAPAELASESGQRGTSSHVLVLKLLLGRTQVVQKWTDDGFDYIGCASIAGDHGFPSSFGGLSGAGIWHIQLTMDPHVGKPSLDYLNPELIGVAFYETELQNGSRIIRAHSTRGLCSLLA